jgi:hypothetical protein
MAQQSRGECQFCGYAATKSGITKHLSTCPQRQAKIAAATQEGGEALTLHHLRVQSADSSSFWLDLEVRGSASLKDIDTYLRGIWLECCGHLSEFGFHGAFSDRIGKTRKVDVVFHPGIQLTHVYDFGTTSETQIKSVSQRQGIPLTKKPVVLMARNLMPVAPCLVCNQPATYLCMECIYEDDTSGLLCSNHVKNHPHINYGEPSELVNSPRMGMCGYEGPAEPPY